MHGLIFETSVWLLAESTRLLLRVLASLGPRSGFSSIVTDVTIQTSFRAFFDRNLVGFSFPLVLQMGTLLECSLIATTSETYRPDQQYCDCMAAPSERTGTDLRSVNFIPRHIFAKPISIPSSPFVRDYVHAHFTRHPQFFEILITGLYHCTRNASKWH